MPFAWVRSRTTLNRLFVPFAETADLGDIAAILHRAPGPAAVAASVEEEPATPGAPALPYSAKVTGGQ